LIKMHFLLTNDVECYSFKTNNFEHSVAEDIYRDGLPKLLGLYSKHDIPCTFYLTADIVEIKPEIVDLIKAHGHEIGCHGLQHTNERALDVLCYGEQLRDIKKAKETIEKISGRIVSFRAPALRINGDTIRVLDELKFKTDSSVASQRFDGPFSFGARNKIGWLGAPRKPYHPSKSNPFKRGDSKILEIPVSAFLLPYVGTTMRASNTLSGFIQKALFFESKMTGKPLVFIIHPNEVIDVRGDIRTGRRSRSPIGHVFADRIRHRIKLRNLGSKATELLDDVIVAAKNEGFEFVTAKEYAKVRG